MLNGLITDKPCPSCSVRLAPCYRQARAEPLPPVVSPRGASPSGLLGSAIVLGYCRARRIARPQQRRGFPMIDLHYWPTPNGKKVTILLEECGLEYKIVPCNIQRGDQFTPEFLKMNPNHRMPTMVDHAPKGGGAPIAVFAPGAI